MSVALKNNAAPPLTLTVLSGRYGIAQIAAGEKLPDPSTAGFWTISKTADEISVIGDESVVGQFSKHDGGWRCLKLEGVFDFSMTGILASILQPLANAGVGILAVSTFNTDYVLVKEPNLEKATETLRKHFTVLDEVTVIDYRPEFQSQFKALNVAWIVKDFELEPIDEFQLDHPDEAILKNGGCILLARHQERIVGTCALIRLDDRTVEMIKMAVDENYRGLHIGRKLGEAIVARGKTMGMKKMILFSNTRGSATAVTLYRKLGFREVPLDSDEFKRANIKMELGL